MCSHRSIPNRRGVHECKGVFLSASFQQTDDGNRRGYACRQVFNRKRVLT